MQFKSRDVAHEDSTMKIDYNTRFLLAVRRTDERSKSKDKIYLGFALQGGGS